MCLSKTLITTETNFALSCVLNSMHLKLFLAVKVTLVSKLIYEGKVDFYTDFNYSKTLFEGASYFPTKIAYKTGLPFQNECY